MTNERVAAKVVPCVCPRCRKKHRQRIHFTGRGTPRLYCYDCKNYFEKYEIFDDTMYWRNYEKEPVQPELDQFDYLQVPTVRSNT